MTTMMNARAAILFSALAAASMSYAQDAAVSKYRFQSYKTGKCMVGAVDGRLIAETCSSTRTNQQWEWYDRGNGFVSLKNVGTQKCIRFNQSSYSLVTCALVSDQYFNWYPSSSMRGYITLLNIYPNVKAWCVANASGTTVAGFSYPSPCIEGGADYTWKKIAL